eukprot:6371142-Amphidinium_carterae.3
MKQSCIHTGFSSVLCTLQRQQRWFPGLYIVVAIARWSTLPPMLHTCEVGRLAGAGRRPVTLDSLPNAARDSGRGWQVPRGNRTTTFHACAGSPGFLCICIAAGLPHSIAGSKAPQLRQHGHDSPVSVNCLSRPKVAGVCLDMEKDNHRKSIARLEDLKLAMSAGQTSEQGEGAAWVLGCV